MLGRCRLRSQYYMVDSTWRKRMRFLRSILCAILCICCMPGYSIRLGLFNGDVRHTAAPIILRRYHHHAPVYINIQPPPQHAASPHFSRLKTLQPRHAPVLNRPPILQLLMSTLQPKMVPVKMQFPRAFPKIASTAYPKTAPTPTLYPKMDPTPTAAATCSLRPVRARLAVLNTLTQLHAGGALSLEHLMTLKKLLFT